MFRKEENVTLSLLTTKSPGATIKVLAVNKDPESVKDWLVDSSPMVMLPKSGKVFAETINTGEGSIPVPDTFTVLASASIYVNVIVPLFNPPEVGEKRTYNVTGSPSNVPPV